MVDKIDVLEIADKLIKGIMDVDVDTVRSLYHPDAKIWHNHTDDFQSVEDNIASIHAIHTILSDLRYDVVRREVTSTGYFQQHILRGTTQSGDEFKLHACVIIDINDQGQITRLDEYLDSASFGAK